MSKPKTVKIDKPSDEAIELIALLSIPIKVAQVSKSVSISLIDPAKDIFLDLSAKGVGEVIMQSAKEWDTSLSKKDIKSILEFLKSPLGKKFLEAAQANEQGLMDACGKWVQELLHETEAQIRARNLSAAADRFIDWKYYLPPLDLFPMGNKPPDGWGIF